MTAFAGCLTHTCNNSILLTRLKQIRQIQGVTGVITTLYDTQPGEVWSRKRLGGVSVTNESLSEKIFPSSASPTKWGIHLPESIFQTRSSAEWNSILFFSFKTSNMERAVASKSLIGCAKKIPLISKGIGST